MCPDTFNSKAFPVHVAHPSHQPENGVCFSVAFWKSHHLPFSQLQARREHPGQNRLQLCAIFKLHNIPYNKEQGNKSAKPKLLLGKPKVFSAHHPSRKLSCFAHEMYKAHSTEWEVLYCATCIHRWHSQLLHFQVNKVTAWLLRQRGVICIRNIFWISPSCSKFHLRINWRLQ